MRRAVLLIVLSIVAAGCIRQQRFGRVPGSAMDAQHAIDRSAQRAGLDRLAVPAYDGWFRRWDASYYGKQVSHEKTSVDVNLRTHAVGQTTEDATIVELSAKLPPDQFDLARLLPDGQTYVNWNGPRLRRLAWSADVELSAGAGPRDTIYRLDAIGRFGLHQLYGATHGPAPVQRYALGILAGGGYVRELDERHLVRADLTVLGARQNVAEPVPGHVIAEIPMSLSLSAVYLHSLSDPGHAIELELSADLQTYGGLFARAGYEWNLPGSRAGVTYSAGLKAGPRGAFGALAAAGLVVGFTLATWYGAPNIRTPE